MNYITQATYKLQISLKDDAKALSIVTIELITPAAKSLVFAMVYVVLAASMS